MARAFRIPLLGSRITIHGKDEGLLWFAPELRGRLIKGDRSPTIWGKRELGLSRLFKKSEAYHYALTYGGGALLSQRLVTDTGVAFLVDDWDNNAKDITNFNAHGNGTGTTAEAVGNTALVAETGTRVSGTKSQPAANQIQTIGTIAQDATRAITEHGLLDSTTVAGSTLWDRSVFSAINVVNGDSIEFTYTLTVNSGG